ncbi:unnamed protein product [Urochloa decumbens]|uniref:Uncharacterized protein n=1 Tax=Urochloa decumbens TaxID=240449 RepID=A0ABC8WVG0_9POAL
MAAAKIKSTALSVNNKCRNILAAGWEAHLNTIKVDAKGSEEEVYTSRVHYMIQKGTPYLIMLPHVAMAGDVLCLKDSKVPIIADSLKKAIMKEHEASSAASYRVILKFDIGSCIYIDSSGSNHNIELDSFEPPKPDLLMPFSAKLIDGINRNDSRRRALILFCFEYFDVLARDAAMLSIDHHGIDVVAKVPERATLANVPHQYH